LRLEVGRQRLIINLDETIRRQHPAPMVHQLSDLLNSKLVKYIDRQVSTEWCRQWTKRALGKDQSDQSEPEPESA
jgi:hypothetical protein